MIMRYGGRRLEYLNDLQTTALWTDIVELEKKEEWNLLTDDPLGRGGRCRRDYLSELTEGNEDLLRKL